MSSTYIFTFLMVFSLSIFQSTELPSQLNDFDLKIQQGNTEIEINTSQQTIDLAKEKFTVFFNENLRADTLTFKFICNFKS